MNKSLRILHLEDNAQDAELIQSSLVAEWPESVTLNVTNKEVFERAVLNEPFDVILADYALPHYNGTAALAFVRERHPETPFILISGTLGEEQAVDSLKQGATDYVLKQRLPRLIPAIRRAVLEAEEHEKLRQTEQQVREQAALLDKARDAIHVCDLNGVISYWNQGAERIYGWNSSEAVGKLSEELIVSQVGPPPASREYLAREKEWVGELSRVRKDGGAIIVESRWTLVCDDAGLPSSILIIDTDITEKKKLEEQFLRAQRMESVGALAGGIAHDLNNILAPILMVTEMVRGELRTQESRELLDLVNASAQRGAAMVKQILTFARGVGGEHTMLQVNQVIEEMVNLARDTFARGLRVQTILANELSQVNGDATQLHRLLMNLLVNARDAMPKGGSITVETKNVVLEQKVTPMRREPVSGDYVLVKVSDTGDGVPAHLLSKIFEPFFTTKAPGKGTGLGLSSVLSIVKSHNGFVEVASQQGSGTTFEIYLPACGVRVGLKGEPKPRISFGNGEQILVIEDDVAVLEMAREILGYSNYRVITAAGGAEGVSLYKQHQAQISAVVTDLVMPGMDGKATLEAMKKINPRVRAICVSGFDVAESTKKQFNACLQKPYEPGRFLNTLREVLDVAADRS